MLRIWTARYQVPLSAKQQRTLRLLRRNGSLLTVGSLLQHYGAIWPTRHALYRVARLVLVVLVHARHC